MNQLIENSIDIEQKWGKDHFPLLICRQKEAMKQIIHFQLCKIMCHLFYPFTFPWSFLGLHLESKVS